MRNLEENDNALENFEIVDFENDDMAKFLSFHGGYSCYGGGPFAIAISNIAE